VTDSTWHDGRREDSGERPGGTRRRRPRYLPSAQVVQELASIGDLSKLAEELRSRLTDGTPDTGR
jgi:hypothetical protein